VLSRLRNKSGSHQFTPSHHGPNQVSDLARKCDGGNLGRSVGERFGDPWRWPVPWISGVTDHRERAVTSHGDTVALLADVAEPLCTAKEFRELT
jgi:hypothetical protein